MWTFLSVVVICITVLYWSNKYLMPVQKGDSKHPIQEIPDKDQPINFDDIIAEIYDRLDEKED